MSLSIALIILASTLITAFISGIFGMAGGLILMGILIGVTSIPQAMVIHGALQFTANFWRAFLLRDHLNWRIIRRYMIGAVGALTVLSFLNWSPDEQLLYIILGLIPFMIWLPKRFFHLDILITRDNFLCGFLVSGLNLIAGVAGPILDLFFVNTNMNRKEIVANKSSTQALAHLVKIAFWTGPAMAAYGWSAFPAYWFFLLSIPLSMLGTWCGGRVLHHMSEDIFKRWMKALISLIGISLLARGIGVY